MDKKYAEASASILNEYSFSSDGKIVVHFVISDDRNHYKYGTWNYRNYILTINLDREIGEKGIGEPKHCSATCTWDKYEYYERQITEKIVYDRYMLNLFLKIEL